MNRPTLEKIKHTARATAAHEIALSKGIPPAPASAEARRMAAARKELEDRRDMQWAQRHVDIDYLINK